MAQTVRKYLIKPKAPMLRTRKPANSIRSKRYGANFYWRNGFFELALTKTNKCLLGIKLDPLGYAFVAFVGSSLPAS
jgi:hypothetical protein